MNAQIIVEISTVLIFILSTVLSIFLTADYLRKKNLSFLFWAAGLWAFSLAVLLEILFSAGIFSQPMIKLYLFLVAELVLMLSLGSLSLFNSRYAFYYYMYASAVTAYVIIALLLCRVGYIISNYVVYGPLPLQVVISSSLVTFPAAVIIVLIAAISFMKKRDKKMISIIAGVIIVSIAGTLYIASFPAFLYYAEFIGILLLWAGFFDPSIIIKNNNHLRGSHTS
ncbi:MAG: hypothetical protein ACP5UV_00870 [Thermoplasmata archaeon]